MGESEWVGFFLVAVILWAAAAQPEWLEVRYCKWLVPGVGHGEMDRCFAKYPAAMVTHALTGN